MNEEYDVIVLGTGLKECILSGLLSVKGKKVLHLDRNSYYGGETASLNLTNLWEMFRKGQTPPEAYGHNRDWNVDLIPKFIMANGKLVKMLLHTKVTRYLEWKCVDAQYVAQHKKAGMFSKEKLGIYKVPTNASEGMQSSLLSLFQKKNFISLISFLDKFDVQDPSTYGKLDPQKNTMADYFKKFGLDDNSVDFLGHAVAMYREDSYLERPALETFERFQLFLNSMNRYGDSPFLYPIYGLGGLPESFSRLCAIHGGTYMLNTKVDEILVEDGKCVGIRSGSDVAKAPMVICDPSYVTGMGKTQTVGKVIRAICLLDKPIPGTKDVPSIQIILPARQLGRKSDMYITMVSYSHAVCAKNMYIAIASGTVETDDPEAEIRTCIDIIGQPLEIFIQISEIQLPTDDGKDSQIFVTSSYDATSHFESASDDVLELYEKITGEKFDLNVEPPEDEEY